MIGHSQIALKPVNHIKNLCTKIKDKIYIPELNDVAYEIRCKNCNKLYIGYTTKWINNRIYQQNISLTS